MTLHDDLTTALCTLHAAHHERRDGQPVVVLTEVDWRAVRDAIERVRAEVGTTDD